MEQALFSNRDSEVVRLERKSKLREEGWKRGRGGKEGVCFPTLSLTFLYFKSPNLSLEISF